VFVRDEREADDWPEKFEKCGGNAVPSEVWVQRADEALGPEQVNDEDDKDAGDGEDLSRNGETDVVWVYDGG
jgi:hypothetical protein